MINPFQDYLDHYNRVYLGPNMTKDQAYSFIQKLKVTKTIQLEDELPLDKLWRYILELENRVASLECRTLEDFVQQMIQDAIEGERRKYGDDQNS